MKKKTYLTLAAGLLLAGCAVDDQQGAAPTTSSNNSIAFNMQTASQIRAGETSDAHTKLNNMFIVWGEKGENQTSAAAAKESNTVFKNYVVEYKDGSAISGTSNTANWEYVGMTPFTTNVTPNIGSSLGQTIKYWDDTADSYTFTAVSAKKDDINGNKVIITKNPTEDKTVSSVYEKGYTVQVKSGASINDIYFSDRNYITKGTGYNHNAVTMSFRSFMSKIRFGIYETMVGYKVVITGIKYNNADHPGEGSDKKFGVDGNFVVAGDNTKYTVTYESTGSNQNKAKVELGEGASTQAYLNTTGTQWLSTSWTSKTDNNVVATAATSPTYDKEGGAYTTIMPNPSNKTEMTLTIKYDLYSEDTGEKISVGYKTVKVPAQYCQWKSNYAYTYLFKITDQNTGLNPISFDAVVVAEDNGTWEDITEVDDPSITTFATKSETDKTIVTGKNEYEAGNSIYAVVMDKNDDNTYSAAELTSSNIKLYTVTTNDATNFPITEANVAQSIANTSSAYKDKITCTAVSMEGDTPAASIVSKVPAEDGTEKEISALKWTAEEGTYAIEYSKTVGTDTKKYYKIVKVAAAPSDAKKH